MPKKKQVAQVEASVLRRFAAYCVDLCILFLIVFIPFIDVFLSLGDDPFDPATLVGSFVTSLFVYTLAFMYFVLLERRYGQSIGKMVVGITVADQPSTIQHVVRNSYLLAGPLIGPLVIIDSISVLFTQRKQRISELLSQTSVIIRGGQ